MAFTMMEQLTQVMADIAGVRRAGVRELRAQGWTLAKIADMAGITLSRVKQIEDPTPRRPMVKREALAHGGQPRHIYDPDAVDRAVRQALEDAGRGE
jgi:hypothetical protein